MREPSYLVWIDGNRETVRPEVEHGNISQGYSKLIVRGRSVALIITVYLTLKPSGPVVGYEGNFFVQQSVHVQTKTIEVNALPIRDVRRRFQPVTHRPIQPCRLIGNEAGSLVYGGAIDTVQPEIRTS